MKVLHDQNPHCTDFNVFLNQGQLEMEGKESCKYLTVDHKTVFSTQNSLKNYRQIVKFGIYELINNQHLLSRKCTCTFNVNTTS